MAQQDKQARDAERKVERTTEAVDERMAQAQEQGFHGVRVDPTPDRAYSVEGVTKGLPTPETDPKQAAKVDAHQAQLGEVIGDPARAEESR